jgi:hypothetical protein
LRVIIVTNGATLSGNGAIETGGTTGFGISLETTPTIGATKKVLNRSRRFMVYTSFFGYFRLTTDEYGQQHNNNKEHHVDRNYPDHITGRLLVHVFFFGMPGGLL